VTQRTITVEGVAWTASVAGRFTVYERDEFPLLFERVLPDGTREQRLSRFSPLGSRSRDAALQELSDAEVIGYFRHSQPAWTSPELGYAGA
jgi:hypothetical protein